MTVISKLRTLRWFATRPELWGQAVELVRRKFEPNRDTESHRAAATRWCRQHVLSNEELMKKLGQQDLPGVIATVGEDEWNEAKTRAKSCPVEMGGEGHFDLLFACAEATNATRVIETGVAYGWSSYALLASMTSRSSAKLVSTDMPYVQQDLDDYVGIVVPERMRPHWKLLRQADRQALPKALNEFPELDMCHYDSDKSYQGRMWAYPQLWAALRPGGLFVSDDIQDNEGFRHFAESLSGVDWFIAEHREKYVGIIRKPH